MKMVKYGVLASCLLLLAPAANAKESRYAECSRNCQAIMPGKMHRKDTQMGACDRGCQASHWNGTSKGKAMCETMFSKASIEIVQACRYGADRY